MGSHVPPPLPLKKRRLNFQWTVMFTRVYFHQCFKQETRICFPKRYRMPLASFSDVSLVVWICAKRTVGNRFSFSCRANQFVTSHLHFALAFFRNESAENETHEEWSVGSVFSMCNIQNSIDKLFKTSVPFFQIYSKLSFQMYSKF